MFFKSANNKTYLIWIYYFIIKLLVGVSNIFICLLPAFLTGKFFAVIYIFTFPNNSAFFCDVCFNHEHIEAYIHIIKHCLFMCVFAYDILIKETKGAIIRSCSKTDQKGIKIIEHLFP